MYKRQVLNQEKEILMFQIKNDPKTANKPDNIIEKMVMGKLGKFYSENCLLDQPYFIDESVTVSKFIESNCNAKLESYIRFERGEGLDVYKRQVLLFSEDLSESEFLAQAAAAESGSEHPLAQAIVEKAQQEKLNIPQAESFLAYVGSGIRATVCGHTYLAGNLSLMEQHGYLGETRSNTENILASVDQLSAQGKTPLLFARDEIIVGIIAVADTVRDSSREAIRRFLKMGLQLSLIHI